MSNTHRKVAFVRNESCSVYYPNYNQLINLEPQDRHPETITSEFIPRDKYADRVVADMETTPSGTSVGVDDPYAYVDRCDHLTDDGRCRFAVEQRDRDPGFAREREMDDLRCPVGEDEYEWDWCDCPHFRARNRADACVRCGLEEVRMAHTDERPLLEIHHLSYADEEELSHEITVVLCRWCHAKVHNSWARIADDASPASEAIAARETRRARELDEFGFQSAAERREE